MNISSPLSSEKLLTSSKGGQLPEDSPNNWIDIDFALQDRHKDNNYSNQPNPIQ